MVQIILQNDSNSIKESDVSKEPTGQVDRPPLPKDIQTKQHSLGSKVQTNISDLPTR